MKATKATNQAAICILDELNKKIDTLESRTNQDFDDGEFEDFIIHGWLIELQLAKNSKDTIEQWIIEQNFDI